MSTASSRLRPTVSIIIPCLNEANFIERCLRSLLEGDYPVELLEVLVFDGMSTDGTRALLTQLAQEWQCIRVIDNPGASKPVALNRGIAEACSDVVMRIDAHADYAPNYISTLVDALYMHGADNVGAVRRNIPRGSGVVARCLAKVLTHPFGVGNASYNLGVKAPQRTDVVYLFCMRRSLVAEVGGFNEQLKRGQDREFNLRLAHQRRRMFLIPGTECRYYVRSTMRSFVPWAVQAGFVPFQITRIVGRNLLSMRNLVPATFVIALVSGLLLSAVTPLGWWMLLAVLLPYGVLAAGASALLAFKERDSVYLLGMPVVFLVWHLCYGWGSLLGLTGVIIGRSQLKSI